MSGATVLMELDDHELQELVQRMGGAVTDMRPIMRPFGEYMMLSTRERFDREESPSGEAWKPLALATIEAKDSAGDLDYILRAQGNLLHSIVPKALPDGVKLSSNMVYSAIHQFGGQAGRGHSAKIPQREYLGFSDADLEEFKDTVKDWIMLGRRP